MTPQPNSLTHQLSGVLIEGSDYAGKSTVARILVNRLTADGFTVDTGKCYLTQNPVVTFLDNEARRYDDLLARDKFYSAAIVCDLECARVSPPRRFRVQERHWLSQLGRNLFFHPAAQLIPEGYLEAGHMSFTTQIMLYSDIASKKRRSLSRPPESPRDRLLLGDPGLHQAYDEFIKTLLPSGEAWSIIDISEASPNDVAGRIYDQIQLPEHVTPPVSATA